MGISRLLQSVALQRSGGFQVHHAMVSFHAFTSGLHGNLNSTYMLKLNEGATNLPVQNSPVKMLATACSQRQSTAYSGTVERIADAVS